MITLAARLNFEGFRNEIAPKTRLSFAAIRSFSYFCGVKTLLIILGALSGTLGALLPSALRLAARPSAPRSLYPQFPRKPRHPAPCQDPLRHAALGDAPLLYRGGRRSMVVGATGPVGRGRRRHMAHPFVRNPAERVGNGRLGTWRQAVLRPPFPERFTPEALRIPSLRPKASPSTGI